VCARFDSHHDVVSDLAFLTLSNYWSIWNLCSDGAMSKKKTQKQLIKEKDEQDRLQREAEAVC
jgi:hypothetical protein